jgi:putative redox protein
MNDISIPPAVAELSNQVEAANPPKAGYSARTRWIEGVKFLGQTGSGHSMVMEGANGDDVAMRPMELFLVGLGGCSAVDVMWLLQGMKEDVTGCDIQIDGDRATNHPQVFTHIRIRYRVSGRGLSPMKVKLALKMSQDRLCSASAMLGKTAEITTELELLPA